MSTILLVEDDFLIVDTTSELLSLLGHQVFAVNTGGSALVTLAAHKDQVDMVLLDLSLPDMKGCDLIPELASKYPDLKIVIFSGSLPDELDFENQPTVKGVLNKPFELSELRGIIDKVVSCA